MAKEDKISGNNKSNETKILLIFFISKKFIKAGNLTFGVKKIAKMLKKAIKALKALNI